MSRFAGLFRLAVVRELVFWFGYNSPYSMLAHQRIEELLLGHDVRIRYRPWFTGVRLPDYNTPKVQYVVEDVIRHARAYGLALRPGPSVDLGSACRGFLLARERGHARAFNDGVRHARWFEVRDISLPGVLHLIAEGCGLEREEFEEAIEGGLWSIAMAAEISDGQAAGVFGVPFFELEGHTFWGNDRLEWLLVAVRGDTPVS